MSLLRLYRRPGLTQASVSALRQASRHRLSRPVDIIDTEVCFYIQSASDLSETDQERLRWLLGETFDPDGLGGTAFLDRFDVVEYGPRMSFTTAWSTNATAIFHACGLDKVERIERSRRYHLSALPEGEDRHRFDQLAHDRMTEQPYVAPLSSFESGVTPEPVQAIPLIEEGRVALERINKEMGLAFDEWDLDYYSDVFLDKLKRNPTNVECFDVAQSNSEHSRHWFFRGKLIVDGQEIPDHLIGMIRGTLEANPNNSLIAFKDNSSAIEGYRISTLLPEEPGRPTRFAKKDADYAILLTAETHNFPSGVAPYPGAETGTGGRIRDTHATGRGSLVVAGTAGYCVGNLSIPGYDLPWEADFAYPDNLAAPLVIEIEASNGASNYGNEFGEPVIQGFTRAFGLRLPDGERREWIKPIMFSAGIGQIDATHTEKQAVEVGMRVIKLGGPAYRIGMGGGAASSMVQGENAAELDFNAVQRGDAEMAQKVNRVIRACVELGENNPIVSIHDQGAGGNCNVLKEIVEPLGARINLRDVHVGDHTLSALEIWGAEYQENDALLVRAEHESMFRSLCEREKVPVSFVGDVTGDGRIVVHDSRDDTTPVDLDLGSVLGDMPQKTFTLDHVKRDRSPLLLPPDLSVRNALDLVLRLVSVGSKKFLTNKVDRSVTGLVAQQQCVGPLQLPLADVAVIAQSHFPSESGKYTGAATAIGEQPIKGLIDPAAMARMTVGEALTNIVWASVSELRDIKCSGNWMWAAKLDGEGAELYDAAVALCDVLVELGIGIDGGKDSLSMAALAPIGPDLDEDETVKSPGTLVISAYVTCPDITKTVTPDFKDEEHHIFLVDLSDGRGRLGGSALAQVFGQVGDESPDMESADLISRAFNVTQRLIDDRAIAAGHDRSDGGLLTTLLEMGFAGDRGFTVDLDPTGDIWSTLFSEELGLVLAVEPDLAERVREAYSKAGVACHLLGFTTGGPDVVVRIDGETVLEDDIKGLRQTWEATSHQLERLQANVDCVEEEYTALPTRQTPPYILTFEPAETAPGLPTGARPRVAILREEGSNGDREMTSAFYEAGFETWDVTMSDLAVGRASLETFQGVVFVGGFSYADVLDSAKGWAGVIRYNERVLDQFTSFRARSDTFSLGVCNGCQLMALLGWVNDENLDDTRRPRFIHNVSGRFESRFSTVQIQNSRAMMLDGMAGSTLGVWVAHGEGRAYFPDSDVLESSEANQLIPLRYVDDSANATEVYPHNPNGSTNGIAGLCSADGRHLVMMPHPERAFRTWQWGWLPPGWEKLEASPWLRMFQNARTWCD
jgi:phosphoribosylformylglycinamidine synthase